MLDMSSILGIHWQHRVPFNFLPLWPRVSHTPFDEKPQNGSFSFVHLVNLISIYAGAGWYDVVGKWSGYCLHQVGREMFKSISCYEFFINKKFQLWHESFLRIMLLQPQRAMQFLFLFLKLKEEPFLHLLTQASSRVPLRKLWVLGVSIMHPPQIQ